MTDTARPAGTTGAPEGPATFRTPLAALVAVVFLALSLSPVAFVGGWWFALFAVPVAIAWWLLRTRTTVDDRGLRVRTAWGSARWPWSRVATLRLDERSWVRAVDADGDELVLRGVRVRDLGRLGAASGGRVRVPTPAEAAAADEHRRELDAARLRIARLREQHLELIDEGAQETGVAEAPGAQETASDGDTRA